jgi:MHS family proline/betaine transporter-like MFS transporter
MGLVALWLRLKLEETPSFERVEKSVRVATPTTTSTEAAPVTRPGRGELARTILLGIGRLMGWSAAGYTFLVVMPAYLQTSLNATFQQALLATVLANVGFALTILPAGILSDRIGRRTVMMTGVLLILLLALPLLNLLQDTGGALPVKALAVLLAGAAVGLIAGPGPAMLSEMFPTTVRYTGLGLSYSLSNAVFAGSAGLIITSLIKSTKNLDIPAYYVMATCAVSAVALLSLRGDDHQRDLLD